MPAAKPTTRPGCPNFGSGPCAKRPGWKVESLDQSGLGRSHRSSVGKAKLKRCCTETHELLGLPADYRVGLVPASDTGAVEMIMWNMLGERPVDMCYWETFGKTWYADAIKELKLPEVLEISSDEYGILPDLSKTNPKHDIVFTWNGTTAGVRVPNSEWIADDREGLTICDATSAIFGADMAPWHKLDVITYSWQKVLGGEGGHGMLILSPRAVARLESYKPPRPLPKIFRLTSGGKLIDGIFHGETINTPSMLCVEDYLDALAWSRSVGGLQGLLEKTAANFAVMEEFVERTPWIRFLCETPHLRSNTSTTYVVDLPEDKLLAMRKLVESEGVCYDVGAYKTAPAGLRIWCGATVQADDLKAMLPWLEWAYAEVSAK